MSEITRSPSHGVEPDIDPAARRRSRIQLVAIVAAFAVPLVLAVIWLRVVQSGGGGEMGDTSRGELIEPAVPLEPFALAGANGEPVDLETFRGLWTLLYVPSGECGEVCEKNLYHMRQVRLALNHRMTRVQRMVVPADGAPLGPALVAEHPGLIVAGERGEGTAADGGAGAREAFLAQVEAAQANVDPLEEAIYLVDPFGNLMMRFAPDLPPKSMLKDVKHLLKVSRIG